MDKVFIYRLVDPFTKEVRYIGKAANLLKRYRAHCNPNRNRGLTRVNKWVLCLLNKNERPIIELIEETDKDNWENREIFWIFYYKSIGCDLCNLTIGGEGLKNCSEETKNKMRENNKRNLYKYQTKEFKDKISALSKALVRTPEHCEKIRLSKIGKKRSEDCKRKISESKRGVCNMSKERYREVTKNGQIALAKENEKRKKPVIKTDLHGNVLKKYSCTRDCSIKEGINARTLATSIRRGTLIKKTFRFKYE